MTIGRGRFLPQKYIILQKRRQKLRHKGEICFKPISFVVNRYVTL